MSSFNGVLPEFPDIQVDYFRKSNDRPPPLACFLTHAHTDHLQGLESFRAPFIYCSAITRQLLLRMERWDHRINFDQGIIEAREVTYRHLKTLLRPIPLNTPTTIWLTPIKSIRVTLIDANHCPGSVMFLFEGQDQQGQEKTVLYTGDIRAEKWWTENLLRNPFIIPHVLGGNRMDNIYLDTTYLHHVGMPPSTFFSKAAIIADLVQQLKNLPNETFHISAWTFGYEELWVALAAALNTQVHVDAYQMSLYQGLCQGTDHSETASITGFMLGNDYHPGYLSSKASGCRLHLCMPPCAIARRRETIALKPYLGVGETIQRPFMPDLGIGGGSGDAYLPHDLELPGEESLEKFTRLCMERMTTYEKLYVNSFKNRLREDVVQNGGKIPLSKYGIEINENVPLSKLADDLVEAVVVHHESMLAQTRRQPTYGCKRRVVYFAWARHSSYHELRYLICCLRPKDIHACVVQDRDVEAGKQLVDKHFGHLLTAAIPTVPRSYAEYLKDAEETHRAWEAEKAARSKRKAQGYPENVTTDTSTMSQVIRGRKYRQLRQTGQTALTGEIWLLRAEVEHDFSSLPIADQTDLPCDLRKLCKGKHDEIQRAREYLQQQSDPAEMQVGPPPRTWFEGLDGAADRESENKRPEVQDTVQDGSQSQGLQAKEPQVLILTSNAAEIAGIQQASRVPANAQSPPESTFAARDSQLSILHSAVVCSQISSGSTLLTRERLEALNTLQRREMSMKEHRRARIEAFLAANEDNYKAWTAISLTSVRDSHGEKEKEL